ncbi:PH domain-containing protein [Alishewanella sp. 16-MA]|uniref:PH domain-containing protein n=1 Tax=Alishewanella maricola TaxID=2795740 RepID=A0ABS8C7P0_9ALTE|nr:PH domain-containing protein [Alishewanella maricola]MCB5228368.1 PH domain-containing protein [Alishewanella maricola]
MDQQPFYNLALSDTDLPALAQLNWQPLSPKYKPLIVALDLGWTALLTLLWLVLLYQPFWPVDEVHQPLLLFIGLLISGLGLLLATWDHFALPTYAYALRQHDLSFQRGLFFRKSTTQPLLRIQHIELKQGPLDRWANLATLQVFSAGGAMHTFQIPGLPADTAQQIRQLILQHKDMQQHG